MKEPPPEIQWSRTAKKCLEHLPPDMARRILVAVAEYAASGAGDVKRLQGVVPTTYRLRVGDYRVLFTFMANILIVSAVAHRREAYR